MVAILDATDVAQVGRMVLIMDNLALNPTLNCSDTRALLALGARLFNGDCVAALKAAVPASSTPLEILILRIDFAGLGFKKMLRDSSKKCCLT
jgi:hypothetical protein